MDKRPREFHELSYIGMHNKFHVTIHEYDPDYQKFNVIGGNFDTFDDAVSFIKEMGCKNTGKIE